MYGGMEQNASYYEVDPRASSYYRDLKAYYEPVREAPRLPEYQLESMQRTNINPRSFSRSAEYQPESMQQMSNPRSFSRSADHHPMGFNGGHEEEEHYIPQRRVVSEIDAVAVLTKLNHTNANTEMLIIMMYVLIILVVIMIVALGSLMMHQIYRQISYQA
jgi:hypothetical protein